MYLAIIVILVALWGVGAISGVSDLFIHALLAVVAIMLFYKPLGGRRIMR
jgi:hypothetical protein